MDSSDGESDPIDILKTLEKQARTWNFYLIDSKWGHQLVHARHE